ncbi:MAG: DUF4340 domain-containing protein, partial [bacterium]|nr:DUF4340 domain-containing protein [Candidatus Colisoma equi]
ERKGQPAVSLVKNGLNWRLVLPYAGSADARVVTRFVDILSMTPIADVIGESALLKLGRTRGDLSLDEPVLSVVLGFENNESERLDFGSMTPLTNGVFVSIGGMDSVFVVSSSVLEAVDVDAERFRRRALFAIDESSVASFGVKRRTDPLMEFVRAGSEWRLKDAKASSQKVTDLLGKIVSASAEKFIWPIGASNETEHASAALLVGYGLDPDAAVTVTLKGVDGVDRRISFGKEDLSGHVYALVHGGTAIVTLPSVLKDLADQDGGSFTDSRLFPVDSRSVGSFSILDRDVLYAFVRGKDGLWSLESPIVARADDGAVDSILTRILSLSSSDVVAADQGVSVSLATNAAKSVVSRAAVFGAVKPEDLRTSEIHPIDPTLLKRIVRIVGEGGNPVSVLYDRERKARNLENGGTDAVPDSKGIDRVLSVIKPLAASRIEKLKVPAADLDDYGLDKPFLTVAIDQEMEDAVRRNIIIGKKTEGGRFATIGSSDAVFVLGDGQVNALSANIVGK